MKRIICFIFGHIDLEMEFSDSNLFNCCQRCGKRL
jgi:hypothetical protein